MKLLPMLAVATTLVFTSSQTASGALIVNLTEQGGDVIASASGSVNVSSLLHLNDFDSDNLFVDPDSARLFIGVDASVETDRYRVPLGPEAFGPGTAPTVADSGTGDRIGIVGDGSGSHSEIWLPDGYVSASDLSSSAIFNGETIASLGLSEGTYVYSWGSGVDADSLTVEIRSATVPEPSTFAIFALGSVVALCFRRRHGLTRAAESP